jgi:hypothetical protein
MIELVEVLSQTEPNITELILKITGAVKTIGEAMAQIIAFFLSQFRIPIPIQIINILMILLVVFTLFKIGSKLRALY